MQELFREESKSGEVRLTEKELAAVVEAGDARGAGAPLPAEPPSGPRTATGDDLPAADVHDVVREGSAAAGESRSKRQVIVTIFVVLAAAAVAAVLFAGR
jgi:hypothetical protein